MYDRGQCALASCPWSFYFSFKPFDSTALRDNTNSFFSTLISFPINISQGRDKTFVSTVPEEERIAWMWALLIAFSIPEIGAFIRAVRICFFKSSKRPLKSHFLFIIFMESMHTIGVALLMFVVLPELDSVKAAMVTNCLCCIPGIFGLLSRTSKEGRRAIKVLIDLAAISAQITGFVVWPLIENRPILWMIPVGAVMTSCAWWENYVCAQSPIGFVRAMGRAKDELKTTRYFNSIFTSLWKILLFFCSLLMIIWFQGDHPMSLFNLYSDGFGPHKIVVEEVSSLLSQSLPDTIDISQVRYNLLTFSYPQTSGSTN